MKIASYNIQNLFHRHKTLVQHTLSHNVRQWAQELDALMLRADKSPDDIDRVRELTFLLGFEQVDMHRYGTLRIRNGELFLKQGAEGGEPKAGTSSLWNGWLPIQTMPIPVKAQQHKARTILDIGADILLLQEVEDLPSRKEFHQSYLRLSALVGEPERHVFEGNEGKGRGFGIVLRNGFHLRGFVTHRYVRDSKGESLFTLDCQEYYITSGTGDTMVMVLAQFSKESEQLRREQAQALAEIYEQLRGEGHRYIVVSGTFYEPSFANTLAPLLRETDLRSVSRHPEFISDSDLGNHAHYHSLTAYRKGINLRQQDYLLVSSPLWDRTVGAGLHRKGIWPGNHGKWPVFPNLLKKHHAASEHPLLWAEIIP
ncbi:MAG: endonuclease/exonuclease/phosphatase family protein [Flavobacteriaceae bacterium]|nr:endonuclease/exonuclease/phosphatase family protein [Flavobacteriaceae bacterium]